MGGNQPDGGAVRAPKALSRVWIVADYDAATRDRFEGFWEYGDDAYRDRFSGLINAEA